MPINIGGVTVSPVSTLLQTPHFPKALLLKRKRLKGDIVFCEPEEGVAVIPHALFDDVLALMPKLVAADDKVKEDVVNGSAVFDAFKKHRG